MHKLVNQTAKGLTRGVNQRRRFRGKVRATDFSPLELRFLLSVASEQLRHLRHSINPVRHSPARWIPGSGRYREWAKRR